ncbi:hypothetical protein SOVF_085160, partial [Spinacia oleracea]
TLAPSDIDMKQALELLSGPNVKRSVKRYDFPKAKKRVGKAVANL